MWALIAFVSGILLPIQAGLNTKLGKSIHSPVHASLISFAMGAIALIVYFVITKQTAVAGGAKDAPSYEWISGALGAFYVTATILAFPHIGPALTFGLVVAGQMAISVLLDHFGILVMQSHPINIQRILGVALIIGGVILIRKF